MIFIVIAVAGLLYVKWMPYLNRAFVAANNHSMGNSILIGNQSRNLLVTRPQGGNRFFDLPAGRIRAKDAGAVHRPELTIKTLYETRHNLAGLKGLPFAHPPVVFVHHEQIAFQTHDDQLGRLRSFLDANELLADPKPNVPRSLLTSQKTR